MGKNLLIASSQIIKHMKFGIVIYPGAKKQAEMQRVLGTVMGQEVANIHHQETDLGNFTSNDCIVLPGGSSFGDYLRPGALATTMPVLSAIRDFTEAGGYVMGLGNGFQILCEAGLLPGVLLQNDSARFQCLTTYVKIITSNSPITAAISPDEILRLPIAHGFGRYFVDDSTLEDLESHDQILLKYCNEKGDTQLAHNPNGARANIAGICNRERNVFGMMPHPERAAETVLHNTDGRSLLESLVRTAKTDIINQ